MLLCTVVIPVVLIFNPKALVISISLNEGILDNNIFYYHY